MVDRTVPLVPSACFRVPLAGERVRASAGNLTGRFATGSDSGKLASLVRRRCQWARGVTALVDAFVFRRSSNTGTVVVLSARRKVKLNGHSQYLTKRHLAYVEDPKLI